MLPYFLAIAVLFELRPIVLASSTDGTIDSANRFAWSENAGWIDFGSTEGNVHVTDSALTGYAWGENIGWISLNCSNDSSCATVDYKVINNSEGTLGGHAWSENTGWIVFGPSGGGITVNSSGIFSGYAWAENKGWISFNCSDESSCATADYKVSTDWRPQSTRSSGDTTTTVSTTQSGGGSRGGSESPTMRTRIVRARSVIIARFRGNQPKERVIFKNEKELKLVVERREQKTAERIAARKAEIAERKVEITKLQEEKDELERQYAEKRKKYISHMIAMAEKRLSEREAELLVRQEELKKEQERNEQQREWHLAERERIEAKKRLRTSAPGTPASLEEIAQKRGRLYVVVDGSPVILADVRLDEWYAPYVSYVVEEKIATGYKDEKGKPKGEFGVQNPVTIAEALKMALESAGEDLTGIPTPRNSSAKGTWASAYAAVAEQLNFTIMTPGRNLHEPATRGEVISIILQALKLPLWINEEFVAQRFSDLPADHPYRGAILSAAVHGIIDGDTDGSGNPLYTVRPDDYINRAEVCKIVALVKEAFI